MRMVQEIVLKEQIFALIKMINDKGSVLLGDQYSPIIPLTSLDQFKLTPPELGCIRSVAWLYVLYFESGKVNIKFIIDKYQVYKIDEEGSSIKHKLSINYLRTSLQHDLFANTSHNNDIKSYCKIWYLDHCGSECPEQDIEWENCLLSILKDANLLFASLNACIDNMLNDNEYIEVIRMDWKEKLTQYHAPHEYDRLIETIASDMGIGHIDSRKFREKHYQSWSKELSVWRDETFESAARRVIERDILANVKPVLPIDGHDIMEHFGIPPGKLVGDLLTLGYRILDAPLSAKEQFLCKLQEEAEKQNIL